MLQIKGIMILSNSNIPRRQSHSMRSLLYFFHFISLKLRADYSLKIAIKKSAFLLTFIFLDIIYSLINHEFQ